MKLPNQYSAGQIGASQSSFKISDTKQSEIQLKKGKILMKIKLIFIFLILLIFTGYGKKYSITPDRLSTAYINQEYKQTIKISGGKVVDRYASLEPIIPKELGRTIQPIND